MRQRCAVERQTWPGAFVQPSQPDRTMTAARPALAIDTVAWFNLLGLAVVWGFSFFFVEVALTGIEPFMLVQLRVLIAGLAMWPVILAMRIPVPRDARTWAALFGFGLINNAIPYSLMAWGQTFIQSTEAAILNATAPIFTVVIAHVATSDEKLTAGKLAGAVAGFAGVAILVDPRALFDGSTTALGALMLLGMSLAYAARQRLRPPDAGARADADGGDRHAHHLDPADGAGDSLERDIDDVAAGVAGGWRGGRVGGARHLVRLHLLLHHPAARRRHQPVCSSPC